MKHPKEMYLLALTEMCQRFAFWSIGNLLVIYLVQGQKFSDIRADHLFGIFTGISFVLPVIGGYIADRSGYKIPVIAGSILTAIGCFLLATNSLAFLYPALLCVALGASVFTPSVYTILGKIYHERHHLREAGFSIYYAAVNLGVFIALLVLGEIGQEKNWTYAFTVAGIVQLLGIFPFLKAIQGKDISPAFTHTKKQTHKLTKQERDRIIVISILSFFSILFWLAYNQGGSSMSLFALNFTDRHIGSFLMPPSWLLSTESLFLVLLAFPLSSFYLFLVRKKKDPSPPTKTAFSLLSIGLCFGIMAIGTLEISPGDKSAAINPFYLIGAYFLMAIGEMLIAPIGLSLITHLSPHRYTALLVGVWYLCIGIAFYLGGVVATFMAQLHTLTEFFILFVIACCALGLLLLLFVEPLKRMRHLDSL